MGNSTTTNDPVSLSLPAGPLFIRVARLVAAALANELDVDLDTLDDVRLAVGEVGGLAVAAGAASIDFRFRLDGDRLTVEGRAHPAPIPLDDTMGLSHQILSVAAAEHTLTVADGELLFSLVFRPTR